MLVQRLLTLMMMIAMAFVSSTSVAAALCGHRDAQQHQAALHDADAQVAEEGVVLLRVVAMPRFIH